MPLLFTTQWLADSLIRAICWTLLHSLWQGLLLAAIAGGLILLTRRSVAAVRYNLLATLFFVFLGVVVFTFIRQLNIHTPVNAPVTFTPQHPAQVIPQPTIVQMAELKANQPEALLTRFTGYFNQHAALIVTIWFMIFLAKAVKLIGGLAYIQRIRNHKIYTPAATWTDRLQELSDAVGVRLPVRLLESGLVKVPLVTGILKPIILVPIGLMANLPAEQVEAILLHELAHIRRRDFVVNMAQSFAEILFFFNPAVLWISALIREEREHCCDDMAIAVTQSKTNFIQALVSFQEYQFSQSGNLAMAFPGKKNQLLNRVKRIISNTNKTLNLAERSFLVLCFCLMGILSVVFSQTVQTNKPGKKAATKQEPILPGKKTTVRAITNENTEQPEKQEATATDEPATKQQATDNSANQSNDSSYRPYNTQYDSSYQHYQAIYKPYGTSGADTIPFLRKNGSVMSGVMTTIRDGKEYKIVLDNNKVAGLKIDGVKIPQDKLPDYYGIINSIFSQEIAESDKAYGTRVQESENITNALVNQQAELNLHQEGSHQQLTAVNNKLSNLQAQDKLATHSLLSLKQNLRTDSTRAIQVKPQVSLKKSAAEDIIDDLKKAGIITETNPLSFKLNINEFIVNGKAQPEDVLKKFREKYVANASNAYSYARNGGHTSTSIVIDK
jgi:bla regulator protein BlaR1